MAEQADPGGIDSGREALLGVLARHRVAFVLAGGAAIQSQGLRLTPGTSTRSGHDAGGPDSSRRSTGWFQRVAFGYAVRHPRRQERIAVQHDSDYAASLASVYHSTNHAVCDIPPSERASRR